MESPCDTGLVERRRWIVLSAPTKKCLMAGALVALAILLGTCQKLERDGPMVQSFTLADNGREAELRVGESLKIRLGENASTGYSWSIESLDETLVEATTRQSLSTNEAVGSGGEVEFAFIARRAGTGKIVLRNWRSFEGDGSVLARFTLGLRITP